MGDIRIFFITNTPNGVPIQESESTVKKAQERVARLNARGGDTSRADTPSGNANPNETRTKQPTTSGMRLGAGLGNETMRF